jgi:hypothetical protein
MASNVIDIMPPVMIVIDVNGQQQTLDRNKVRKIFLVERIVTHAEVAPQSPAKKRAAGISLTPHP